MSAETLFYPSLGFAALGVILLLITGNHTLSAYIVGSGLSAAAVAKLLRGKPQAFSVEEMFATVRKAEHLAFNEGVRFALDWEEHYVRGAEPLTPDHAFGSQTLIVKPRPIRKKLSLSNREQRLRAMQADGRKRFFGSAAPWEEKRG